MRSFVLISSILFFCASLLLAQRSNPFDIPQRLLTVQELSPTADKIAILVDTVSVTMDSSVSQHSIEGLDSLIAGSLDTLVEDVFTDNRAFDTIPLIHPSDNPFELADRLSSNTKVGQGMSDNSIEASEAHETLDPTASDDIKGWLILIGSLVSLIMLAFGISLDRARFQNMASALFNSNQIRVLYKDKGGMFDVQFVVLYLLFFLNTAVFLYLSMQNGLMPHYLDWSWIKLILILLSMYAVRHFVLWSIERSFPIGIEVNLFNYSIAVHNSVYGSLLLPFIMGIVFAPEGVRSLMFYIGIGIGIIIYALRQIKGLFMALSIRGVNMIYFFIYLCSVEIAPFLVGWRLLFP